VFDPSADHICFNIYRLKQAQRYSVPLRLFGDYRFAEQTKTLTAAEVSQRFAPTD